VVLVQLCCSRSEQAEGRPGGVRVAACPEVVVERVRAVHGARSGRGLQPGTSGAIGAPGLLGDTEDPVVVVTHARRAGAHGDARGVLGGDGQGVARERRDGHAGVERRVGYRDARVVAAEVDLENGIGRVGHRPGRIDRTRPGTVGGDGDDRQHHDAGEHAEDEPADAAAHGNLHVEALCVSMTVLTPPTPHTRQS